MKFIGLYESTRKDKRLMIMLDEPKMIIHFGSKNASTYIEHKDKQKRDNYIKRHKVNENWDEVNAGSLSRYILWGDSDDIIVNAKNYLRKFNIGI